MLNLVRRVYATGEGGWSGDGAVWSGDDPVNWPTVSNAQEEGSPIFAHEGRGVRGILRVRGADSTRRFDLRVVIEYVKFIPPKGTQADWQLPAGPTPPAPVEPRDIGDGEDFTTVSIDLTGKRIAFHLVPKDGNLADGSIVEIWAESA